MPPSLTAIAESIQRQAASKWLWHANHLAARLGISVAELKEFLLRIQSGGSGVRKEGTWSANPAPYDRKIDLVKNEDNSLNIHLVTSRSKHLDSSAFVEPSPEIVDADSAYVRLGKLRSINKEITLKVQREIVRYVTGTHQTFTQNYKEIGGRRRRTWMK